MKTLAQQLYSYIHRQVHGVLNNSEVVTLIGVVIVMLGDITRGVTVVTGVKVMGYQKCAVMHTFVCIKNISTMQCSITYLITQQACLTFIYKTTH